MIRVHPLRALATLAYTAGLVYLSSIPGKELLSWRLGAMLVDLGHVPLFAVLTLLALWAVQVPRFGLRVGLVGVACLVFAATDEWHQQRVPGRVASLADLRSDVFGILIGLVSGELLRPVVRKLAKGPGSGENT